MKKKKSETQPYYYLINGFVNFLNVTHVIEIGTHKGGSTLSFLYNNPQIKVITIDTVEYLPLVERLNNYENCSRIIEDSMKIKIPDYFFGEDSNVLLFIDAIKDGEWIEKIISKYSKVDYILIDDITINKNMSDWWKEFSSNNKNCFNIVDHLGKNCRNLKSSNYDCGFGIIFKDI